MQDCEYAKRPQRLSWGDTCLQQKELFTTCLKAYFPHWVLFISYMSAQISNSWIAFAVRCKGKIPVHEAYIERIGKRKPRLAGRRWELCGCNSEQCLDFIRAILKTYFLQFIPFVVRGKDLKINIHHAGDSGILTMLCPDQELLVLLQEMLYNITMLHWFIMLSSLRSISSSIRWSRRFCKRYLTFF